jgi:hypothetical protein
VLLAYIPSKSFTITRVRTERAGGKRKATQQGTEGASTLLTFPWLSSPGLSEVRGSLWQGEPDHVSRLLLLLCEEVTVAAAEGT